MQKTINVIVYPPGFAGNFLALVLSLDKRTFPWIPAGVTLESDEQRKEFYSFSALQDSNKAWQGHHDRFDPRINTFLKSSEYDTMIWRVHPYVYYEMYKDMLSQVVEPVAKINFLSVHASSEIEYEHVDKFNERNKLNFFGHEHKFLEKFEAEHDTFKISLDNLFSTEEKFLEEYERINSFLQLTNHYEDALWLYRDWRKARETPRSETAAQLTKDLILKNLKGMITYRYIINSEWIKEQKDKLYKLWCEW